MPAALLAAVAFLLFLAPATAKQAERESGGIAPSALCDNLYTFGDYKKWASRLMGASHLPAKAKKRHRHQVRCSAGPEHRQAKRAYWKRIKRSILPANHDLWVRIGRCEQPGSGYQGIYWSHPGPTYQGGLGFWYGTWDSYKYPGMPANAGQASWRQQMRVANRLLRAYGTSPWGCA